MALADNEDGGVLPLSLISDFASPSFDTTAFIASTMKQNEGAVGDALEDLGAQLSRVNRVIGAHVSEHGDTFIGQVDHVPRLKKDLSVLSGRVKTLQGSMAKIREDTVGPYKQMASRVEQLERMQRASEMLRRILRFLFALRKLRMHVPAASTADQAGPPQPTKIKELAKAAQHLQDIEVTLREGDLEGITIVDRERGRILQAGAKVRMQARQQLEHGVQTMNPSEVAGALQVFFHLKCLPDEMRVAVDAIVRRVAAATADALDTAILARQLTPLSQSEGGREKAVAAGGGARGGGGDGGNESSADNEAALPMMPPAGSGGLWRTALWSRLESLGDCIYRNTLQAWALQRVLSLKTDPVSHTAFLDVVADTWAKQARQKAEKGGGPVSTSAGGAGGLGRGRSTCVFDRFWVRMTVACRGKMTLAVAGGGGGGGGGAVRQNFTTSTLTNRYPRLRQMLHGVIERLQANTPFVSGRGIQAQQQQQQHQQQQQQPNKQQQPSPSLPQLQQAFDGPMCESLLGITGPFLEVYLARSLSRLNEPVAMMFPLSGQDSSYRAAPPTKNDVGTFVSAITGELQYVKGDYTLWRVVARGVNKAVRLFTSKVENMVSTRPAAFDLDHSLTAAAAAAASAASSGDVRGGTQEPSSGGRGESTGMSSSSSGNMTTDQTLNLELLRLLGHLKSALATTAPLPPPGKRAGKEKKGAPPSDASASKAAGASSPAGFVAKPSSSSSLSLQGASRAREERDGSRLRGQGGRQLRPPTGFLAKRRARMQQQGDGGGSGNGNGGTAAAAGAEDSASGNGASGGIICVEGVAVETKRNGSDSEGAGGDVAKEGEEKTEGGGGGGGAEKSLSHADLVSETPLGDSLAHIDGLIRQVVEPFFAAAAAGLEQIIVGVHLENFASTSRQDPMATTANDGMPMCSRYIGDLAHAVRRLEEDHFRHFPDQDDLMPRYRRRLGIRVVSMVTRHASLVRPMEEHGRVKMAQDLVQLEMALESLGKPSSWGAVYDELRALRQLIFEPTGDIARSLKSGGDENGGGHRARDMVAKGVLRPSTVWHHLLSRAPAELPSPHAMAGWDPCRFVEWLDLGGDSDASAADASTDPMRRFIQSDLDCKAVTANQGEGRPWQTLLAAEHSAWQRIRRCLEAYVQRVSVRGRQLHGTGEQAQLCEVYDVILASGPELLRLYSAAADVLQQSQ